MRPRIYKYFIFTIACACISIHLHADDQSSRFGDIYFPSCHNAHNNLTAFPGARIGDIYASGGRGGQVIKVTNLNDDGPGSLREAVGTNGRRTVVFDVAGTISLRSTLEISEPDITIAGQTSPGGICIAGAKVFISTDNVIIRYVDVSPERPTSLLREMLVVKGGCRNIITDHCGVADGLRDYVFDPSLSEARKDSDGDGMPDTFEAGYGFDPKDPLDGARQVRGVRFWYTGLEYYLHYLVQGDMRAEEPARKLTIHLLGDSTMALKSTENIATHYPETGWGMLLDGFFDKDVAVYDFARNGLSTVSCISGGLWQCMLEELRAGDYVFIQFGHNDQKKGTERYAAPEGLYKDNIRMMCRTVKERGGYPVLLSSITRRRFEDGRFVQDSLRLYEKACLELSEELAVPCIDVYDAMSRRMEDLGETASRDLFMYVEPGRVPFISEGKDDRTHLKPAGARMVCGLVLDGIERQLPELAGHIVRRDFIVAQDGGGDFRTIQEAVDHAPDYIKQREVRILVKPGIYREKVVIPPSKEKLHLEGLDPMTTVISWDDFADRPGPTGFPMGTSATSTVFVHPDDFLAENITFENTAGEVGQACAITTDGDRQAYVNCRFIGNQDTIYTYDDDQRQYFRNCWIEGTTDFIFGYGTCFFDECTILSKRNSYITAASTLREREYGYVFRNCKLIHAPSVDKVYLGRPWRKYAKTVFIDCDMADHILPDGWHNWDKPYAEKTTFYAEIGSTGPGASGERVRWTHAIKPRDRDKYVPSLILTPGSKEDKHGVMVPVEWYFKVF